MHIAVCTKFTPDSEAKMSVDGSRRASWGDSPLIISPWDEYAVEEALLLRDEHGGTVTAISMGPEEALEALKHAVAMGADAGNAVMQVLEPAVAESGQRGDSPGRVVVGTAKGDIHTIGKNILAMLLRLSGFQVHDLGVDVPATTFLEAAREVDADIIALSALMTSTMPGQRDVVNLLNDTGDRNTFAVMVGGAPTTHAWCDQIGADGYAETASGAVELAFSLVGRPQTL